MYIDGLNFSRSKLASNTADTRVPSRHEDLASLPLFPDLAFHPENEKGGSPNRGWMEKTYCVYFSPHSLPSSHSPLQYPPPEGRSEK